VLALIDKGAPPSVVGDVVDRLFGGSAESLVMSLVETKHLTPEKLARLQKLVEEAQEKADEDS